MDFPAAVEVTNRLLRTAQPPAFNRSWIHKNAPRVYRYLQRNVRTEAGGIDWDRFTRALLPQYQRQWTGSLRRKAIPYQDQAEVDTVLRKYGSMLYTFIASQGREDEQVRDVISIALVRIAQKGNIAAKQEISGLMGFTIDTWIERNPTLSPWRGYEELIRTRLECCIRRYRYSGSFMRYVFKTLEYSARGMRPLIAYSLDESVRRDKA